MVQECQGAMPSAPPASELHSEPNTMTTWYNSLPSWQETSERMQDLSNKTLDSLPTWQETSERMQDLSEKTLDSLPSWQQTSDRMQDLSNKTLDSMRKSTAATMRDTAEFVEKSSQITVDRMREAAPWVEGVGPAPYPPIRVEELQKGDLVFRKGVPAEFVQVDHGALIVRMQDTGNEVSSERTQVSLGVEASQEFLAVGMRVCIVDLQNRPDLNGCHGSILEYKAQNERWNVKLDSTGEVICANPKKLSVLFAPSIMNNTTKNSNSSFQVGGRVRLEGLQNNQKLNGCQGLLTEFDAQANRWCIKLDSTGEIIRAQTKNLHVL